MLIIPCLFLCCAETPRGTPQTLKSTVVVIYSDASVIDEKYRKQLQSVRPYRDLVPRMAIRTKPLPRGMDTLLVPDLFVKSPAVSDTEFVRLYTTGPELLGIDIKITTTHALRKGNAIDLIIVVEAYFPPVGRKLPRRLWGTTVPLGRLPCGIYRGTATWIVNYRTLGGEKAEDGYYRILKKDTKHASLEFTVFPHDKNTKRNSQAVAP